MSTPVSIQLAVAVTHSVASLSAATLSAATLSAASLSAASVAVTHSVATLSAASAAEGTTQLDPKIQYVITELRAILNGDVTPLTVMMAISQGVLVMRKFGSLTGPQKKAVLQPALYILVAQSSMNENDKMASNLLLDLGFNDAVDNFVFMASGAVKTTLNRFGCCLSAPMSAADPA